MNLPGGTLTFLFTDIEGSTRLWETHPEEMRVALARHDTLLREAIEAHHGYIFKTVGDAFCAAFAIAPDGVAAALAAQRALANESWPESLTLKVRIALHTGAVESRDNDYFGPPLNRVARLLSTGYGEQTILSQVTYDLVRDSLPTQASLKNLGEYRLKDLARPEQIYQLIHPDLPKDFPTLKSLDSIALPNNLPQQVTSFIGREKELAEVRGRLAKTKLLTLTGAGGSGKSRLALQTAADLLEAFPDGAWLVELAPLADSNLVVSTVASVLGVKEEPSKPILTTLTDSLREKTLLLVLDNCEHVLDASAKLADTLMRSCPGVKILATSREGLGIAGEAAYRVPSLSLPEPKQAQTAESLSQFEAVQLFIERAVQTQPNFAVTNANAPALASVCFRLDGIPLAIELAAARARSLSVEEINNKLDQRFRLLTGGSRTALPRQQTLRSLIDWSYDLLNEAEKALLCRLSVFAGGWTLESAEVVCSGEVVEDWEVLDLLTSLCDKSLAIAEEQVGVTRYRLLETVRQYARDLLLESREGETYRSRHLDCFLELAEAAELEFQGANQGQWLNRLEVEHENLRAGLDWSLGEGQEGAKKTLRFCGALMRFWESRGYLSEGRDWCTRALNAPEGQEHSKVRARALITSSTLAYRQGDYGMADTCSQESLAISRELGDQGGIADSLGDLGVIATTQGDNASARAYMEESLTIFREMGDSDRISRVLNNLGTVARRQGDYAASHVYYEESLALRRKMGDRGGVAMSLGNLGINAQHHGDLVAARAFYEESLAIYRELGSRTFIASALNHLGYLAQHQGDYASARALYEESLTLHRDMGNRGGTADSLSDLGMVAYLQGDYESARTYLHESLAIYQETGSRLGIAKSLEGFARLANREGKPEQAVRLWGATEALREQIRAPVPPSERDDYEKELDQARQILGAVAFDAAWQEGRAMPLKKVVEIALS
ncbi:MAG: tetratricopeptide repeat protein [Armatimonas sp.]